MFATVTTIKDQPMVQVVNLQKNTEILKLPLRNVDPSSGVTAAGLSFSPDGKGLALLLEHEGGGLLMAWDLASSRQTAMHVFPAGSLTDARGQMPMHGRKFDWLAGGRAWLAYGWAVIDAESGSILGELGVPMVVEQRVMADGSIELVALNSRRGGARMLVVALDPSKVPGVPALRLTPLPPPASQPTTAPAETQPTAAPTASAPAPTTQPAPN